MKDLPIYDITIEDDEEIQGVSKISLVDVPAIGVNWIALRKVELKLQDVFGYETQHFDICPGAQMTFKNYSEMQLDEDTIGMIRSAAQNADNVFEIEKKVIEAGKATREDLEQVRILVADFKDIISEIDKITNQPQNVDYMDGHIKVVEDLLPKTMMAVRMKKSKTTFAKRECLGCPPNGDGTRVNGEPDKRCKGDGAEKTPKGGAKAPTTKPSGDFQNPKSSEDFTGPKAVEQANNSYVDAIINETTNALTQEYFPDWLKNKQSPPDGPDRGRDYHTAAMRYLGIENDKTWDYDKGKPTKSEPGQKRQVKDLGGYKEVQWSFKKQTFAKKECFACPPNGDGTRVNGEPDRRCKDTKGEGGGKATKGGGKTRAGKTGGSTKSLDAGKKNMENLFENNVEIVGQFGQVQTVLKPEVFEASKEPFKQFSAKAPIGEPPRIGEDTGFKVTNSSGQEFTVYKTDKLYEDNENRGNSYDRKDAAYHESKDGVYFIKRDGTSTRSDILVLGYDTSKAMKEQFEKASGIKVKPSVQYNWNDVQQSTSYFSISYGQGNPNYKPDKFRKQTFAKKECFGCPPNGDGTRVNGEPDKRCKDTKGEGGGKATKGGGGKARGSKAVGKAKSPEESIKSKISNMEPKYPEYVGVNKAGDYVKTTMTSEEGALVGSALNNLREKETEKTKSSNGRTVVERVPYRLTGGVVENDGTRFVNITKDWSYVSTDGIPSRSYGNGGRYFSGDDIGSVVIRPDGTRDYSFKNADEADKFFTKLGLK